MLRHDDRRGALRRFYQVLSETPRRNPERLLVVGVGWCGGCGFHEVSWGSCFVVGIAGKLLDG